MTDREKIARIIVGAKSWDAIKQWHVDFPDTETSWSLFRDGEVNRALEIADRILAAYPQIGESDENSK